MRYLVDSDWIIDATIGRARALETLDRLSADGLGVSIVSVAEIYEGAFSVEDPAPSLRALRNFLDDFAVLPVTDHAAEQFARLRSELRAQGRLIPDLDLMIAATALSTDLVLVTRNVRHFARVPGLRLLNQAL